MRNPLASASPVPLLLALLAGSVPLAGSAPPAGSVPPAGSAPPAGLGARAAEFVPLEDVPGARTILVRYDEPTRLADLEVAAPGAVLRLAASDAWSEPVTPDAAAPDAAGTRFALDDHPPLTLLRVDLPAGVAAPAGAPWVVPHEAPRAVITGLPALTEAVTKLQAIERLPRFWASYPVAAPLAAPGDVVRLPLPLELFVVPGIGPGNVRPMQGDRVIPYTLLAAETLAQVPAAAAPRGGGLDLPLPPHAAQLTQLELVAPDGAGVDAPVEVDYLAVTRPGKPAEPRPGPRAAWRCPAGEAAPCRLFLPLAVPAGAPALAVRFAAGTVPAGVGARLWAPRSALLFAWPAGGDVRLVSGFDPVREDAPQVRSVREQLTGRPARPASVDPAATAAESDRLAARSPWIVAASFVLAGALLGLVIVRSVLRAPRRP